jgi:hypothetical protein
LRGQVCARYAWASKAGVNQSLLACLVHWIEASNLLDWQCTRNTLSLLKVCKKCLFDLGIN